MSSLPPGSPEPITPRDKPQPPRGRDRALSSAPPRKEEPKTAPPVPPPPATPYEYTPSESAGAAQANGANAAGLTLRPPLLTAPPLIRRHIFAWFCVLAVVGIALAFTVPFTLGVYFGNRDRQDLLDRQAVEHFQRALTYESETFTDLAIAELNAALQFKPDYPEARAKLEQLKNTRIAKNDQEPQDVSIAKQLYDGAQDALARLAWSDAIDLLEELRRVKSDYRADEVTAQLVTAYVNAGKDAVAASDVDLAERRFDAALALDPKNTEAHTFRDRANLYVTGTQGLGSNWPNAVLALAELYQRDPNFADVKTKLLQAHIGFGEFANNQGAFCIAARELNAAVALGAGADTQLKAAIANEACKQAILNPTPTATPTPEGGVPLEVTVTPEPNGSAPVSAGGLVYTPKMRVRQNAACGGTGDVKGAVQDTENNPIANVGIKIYNDFGYLPPFARTDDAGEYEIVLGSDNGVFHLVVVDDFGSNASGVLDVDYPGGNVQGCHIVVDWKRSW